MTFSGLSQNFLRTFSGFSPDFILTFIGLVEYFVRIFPGLSEEFKAMVSSTRGLFDNCMPTSEYRHEYA